VALSGEVVNLGKAGPDDWWADHHLATVRLSARSEGARAVFMGIAPSADVARYLGSASYDEISDLRSDPFEYSLTRRGIGGDLSTPPTDRRFWTAQASGPGTQALIWDVKPGNYTAVVMNLHGSPSGARPVTSSRCCRSHSLTSHTHRVRRDPGRAAEAAPADGGDRHQHRAALG
jgi:hypothetical protein